MLVPGEFPSYGGLENLVYSLAESLAREGVDVCIFSPSPGFLRPPPSGVRVYSMPPGIKLLRTPFTRLLRSIFLMFKVYTLMQKEEVDVVHVHQCFPTLLYALLLKVAGGKPLICTSHGEDIQVDRSSCYGVRRSKLISLMLWFLLKLLDAHVVVSKGMVRDAVEAGTPFSKVHVIYNGIDLSKIPNIPESWIHARMQLFGINPKDFIILFLGRLHPKKRPELLVEAMPEIIKRIPSAKLVLAGPGSTVHLKLLAQKLGVLKNVVFTGFVSELVKWALIRRCDVFVLPSQTEAFGISLVEAMACGKPVIAVKKNPFTEIVVDGESGVLVHPDTPCAIAEAVISLALDDERRNRLGLSAARRAFERFDIRVIARRYVLIYQRLKAREVRCVGKGGDNRRSRVCRAMDR